MTAIEKESDVQASRAREFLLRGSIFVGRLTNPSAGFDSPPSTKNFEQFILHAVRIPLGWWFGLSRQSPADGSDGRAPRWRECLVAALESAIYRFTPRKEVPEVAFVRSIKRAALDGPLETVVPAYLHGRVSTLNRAETLMDKSLDPSLV